MSTERKCDLCETDCDVTDITPDITACKSCADSLGKAFDKAFEESGVAELDAFKQQDD